MRFLGFGLLALAVASFAAGLCLEWGSEEFWRGAGFGMWLLYIVSEWRSCYESEDHDEGRD